MTMDAKWQGKVPEEETSTARKSKYHSKLLYLGIKIK
jgi:hypothetical protein